MHARALLLLLALPISACVGTDTDADTTAAAADTMTRAQRDSAIARSKLPGAKAVGKAQATSDAASRRAAQLDSLQQ